MKTKRAEQLELLISAAIESRSRTPEELLDYVIGLYGKEFEKANDEIARLNEANDTMFKIKQKIAIVNRELIAKNAELEQDKQRMDLLEKLVFTNRENEHELHVDFTLPTLRAAVDARLRNNANPIDRRT